MTKYKVRSKDISFLHSIGKISVLVILLAIGGSKGFAQVSASIDSTFIKIGEELRYKVQVEADSTQIVVFPEGQTFKPLEVIESYKIDTTVKGNTLGLTKEYALTQFDSGYYTIPRQKILIGERVFYTDSLKVEVKDVLVDTTKQKMYEIKPLVEVDSPYSWWNRLIEFLKSLTFIIGLVAFLLTLIIVVYFFIIKKKRRNTKKELPPYERAMLALKQIDEAHLIEKDSHKEYYSQLSDTARKYIDEEVYDHAMESTTDELIARLDDEIKSGVLNMEIETIQELKKVLKTADLVKFAKSKPDIITAREDRQVIEEVIHKTKSAIPELTEEELLADEEYRKSIEEKKRRKKIIVGSLAGVALIAITLLVFILVKGFDVVKDSLLGHPTKELAKSEWISSAYGSPPVTISTPKVLIRNNYKLTEEQKQILKGNETFAYGSIFSNLYVIVSTVSNKESQADLSKAVEGAVGYLESQGAKNISVKDEEYQTLGGAKGIKVFGNFDITNQVEQSKKKNEYIILNFAEKGGFQQITVIYDIEDRYAKDIAQRIINSVELRESK